MKQLSNNIRIVAILVLAGLITLGVSSACNIIGLGGGQEEVEGPVAFDILAPPANVKALAGSPIQIQSAHPDGNRVSRVDLLVSREGEPETLIRSDVPENGVVVQQWIPQQPGLYTVKVRGVQADNSAPSEFARQIRVIDSQSSGVAIAQVGAPPAQIEPTIVAATPAPTLTPSLVPSDAGAAFVVAAAVAPEREPTPIPRYPPPPPAPGVPWGPTQDQLPNFTAPVCDAAEFIEVFVPDRNRRISVVEADDIAVKAVAGTTIHRAWRLRNIGTCTWGPGYELDFYGGRAMGSGGVAFESSYPADVARRNVLIDTSRLIVPEGKPNQTAVLEVLLNVPTVPGIHQSYWRMRNPHGVYFGPILGVTLDVIRDCGFSTNDQRVYGAPVINKFNILGVGNVYRPADPINVLAELGESIILEWHIINATNFDIVFEDPTGDIETISTTDTNSRADFLPTTLGPHRITLFADNGSCTSEATVNVDVLPPDDERFRLDIILASDTQISTTDPSASTSTTLQTNRTRIEWEHFDRETDQFFLVAEVERRAEEKICPLFGWDQACYTQFSDWRQSGRVVLELSGQGGQANAATVANVEQRLCPTSFNPEREEYRITYRVQAFKDGRPAEPEFSNPVEVFCKSVSGPPTEVK